MQMITSLLSDRVLHIPKSTFAWKRSIEKELRFWYYSYHRPIQDACVDLCFLRICQHPLDFWWFCMNYQCSYSALLSPCINSSVDFRVERRWRCAVTNWATFQFIGNEKADEFNSIIVRWNMLPYRLISAILELSFRGIKHIFSSNGMECPILVFHFLPHAAY